MLVVSFVAAPLGSVDVRAEQPATMEKQHWSAEKILPPEPGRKACWRRVYDANHLAAHPQQKVTELTFFLRVSGYDAGGRYVFKNPDHIMYNFAISLKRRGNKRALTTSGDCLGEKTVQCVVDCDSGGVTIDNLPSGDGLSIGLEFDIPAETVKTVVAQLKDKGVVSRGWIGVQIQPVTADIAENLGRYLGGIFVRDFHTEKVVFHQYHQLQTTEPVDSEIITKVRFIHNSFGINT
jgi:hypothetical protein